MTTSSVAQLQVQCRRLLHNNVFAMKAWLENNVHSWPETDPLRRLDMQTDEVMQDKETGGCTCQPLLKKCRICVCIFHQPDTDIFDTGDCQFLFLEDYLYSTNCCLEGSLLQ